MEASGRSGYGGHMLYVVPALELTVATTANPTPPSQLGSGADRLTAMLKQHVIQPLQAGE